MMNTIKKIDAIQFTMNHDDGNAIDDIEKSDIILIGVSRTSKTPTSIYLANKGYKVSNIPIVNKDSIPESVRQNKLKKMISEGKPIINGWLQIPSSFSAELMAHQGWDSLTIDMQHGLVDYSNALQMTQAISTTNVTFVSNSTPSCEKVKVQ